MTRGNDVTESNDCTPSRMAGGGKSGKWLDCDATRRVARARASAIIRLRLAGQDLAPRPIGLFSFFCASHVRRVILRSRPAHNYSESEEPLHLLDATLTMSNDKKMKLAVLTSGGDSAGMNAVVRAVVKTAIIK